MNKSKKEGLGDLIGGTLVFCGGSALASYNIGPIYSNICKLDSYSLGVSDVLSVVIPACVATWGAFSPGLIGALTIRDHYKERR